jgi:hypothetical protein
MGDILYVLPGDILTPSATLSLTAGTAAAAYPLVNLQDGNPAKPFKATGTSCTIRATFGGAVTLRGVSLGPHNLVGATVAISNNGLLASTPIVIPANREDGLSINPFLQFAADAATQWNIAISGAAANVAIGELYLIVQFRTLELLLGAQEAEAHKTIQHETDYGSKMKYWLGVSQRRVHGTVLMNSSLATFLTLMRSAQGPYKNLLLIMDAAVNDAMPADLVTDERMWSWITPNSELGQIDLDFLEAQRGPAL